MNISQRISGQVISDIMRAITVVKSLAKKIMKYTTVKISEILKHPTMRMDAKYWIKKKLKKAPSHKRAGGPTSSKLQALDNGPGTM